MTFGEKLKSIRGSLLMSQSEVSDKCGIGITTISNVENSKTTGGYDLISKILAVYGKKLAIVDIKKELEND